MSSDIKALAKKSISDSKEILGRIVRKPGGNKEEKEFIEYIASYARTALGVELDLGAIEMAMGLVDSDFPASLYQAWIVLISANVRWNSIGDPAPRRHSEDFSEPIKRPIELEGVIADCKPANDKFQSEKPKGADFGIIDESVPRELSDVDKAIIHRARGKADGERKAETVSRPGVTVRTTIPSLPEIQVVEYVGSGMFKAVKAGTKFESLISKHHIDQADHGKLVDLMERVGEVPVVWSDPSLDAEVEKPAVEPNRGFKLS